MWVLALLFFAKEDLGFSLSWAFLHRSYVFFLQICSIFLLLSPKTCILEESGNLCCPQVRVCALSVSPWPCDESIDLSRVNFASRQLTTENRQHPLCDSTRIKWAWKTDGWKYTAKENYHEILKLVMLPRMLFTITKQPQTRENKVDANYILY